MAGDVGFCVALENCSCAGQGQSVPLVHCYIGIPFSHFLEFMDHVTFMSKTCGLFEQQYHKSQQSDPHC